MTPSRSLLVAATLLLASGFTHTTAQVLPLGAPVVETIGPVLVGPGQILGLVFPNEVDPTHPKYVYFEGTAGPNSSGRPTTVQIQFDWYLTPTPPGPTDLPQLSPWYTVPVPADGGPLFAEFWIPYCPPWVSLHIQTDQEVQISGRFVHQCVPEPSQFALLGGLGLAGFALARRRHAARG